jgi:DNA-binding transcriptional ArsR family regulator
VGSDGVDSRKKFILGVLVVSVFIFLITVLVFAYAVSSSGADVPVIFEPFIEYHVHFMVLMGLFGVGSGLMAYNILNATIEEQKKIVRANISIIMKFLSPEDRDVVELLIGKGGMTTQSEIARLPGMSRLKAHRAVKKLEERGIVHVEKYGKINMVRLVDELRSDGTGAPEGKPPA